MTKITVSAQIQKPVSEVWHHWNLPESIIKWNSAHPSWHCPFAENDLRVGGLLKSRMEAVDGSIGFDFGGTYLEVDDHSKIVYVLGDGRRVEIQFEARDDSTKVTETFDAEAQNPIEMQQQGWQAILDNFKKYVEAL
ncbi:MAG: polyketide cyclase [Bacteroidetes bacterium]|nr:polyketide cyclase [Bacteroidota bacterium]